MHTRGIEDDLPPRPDAANGDDSWWQWPCCPECGRRRQTRCSTCDLGGDDFPLAEYIPAAAPLSPGGGAVRSGDSSADDQSLLLMCPVCEEAFAPIFYRRCEQCGYDFGSGWIAEPPAGDVLPKRVLLVLAGLVLLCLAVAVYLWWLFA